MYIVSSLSLNLCFPILGIPWDTWVNPSEQSYSYWWATLINILSGWFHVYVYGCFLKWRVPPSHPFLDPCSMVFQYKSSILGYPRLWKPPFFVGHNYGIMVMNQLGSMILHASTELRFQSSLGRSFQTPRDFQCSLKRLRLALGGLKGLVEKYAGFVRLVLFIGFISQLINWAAPAW